MSGRIERKEKISFKRKDRAGRHVGRARLIVPTWVRMCVRGHRADTLSLFSLDVSPEKTSWSN